MEECCVCHEKFPIEDLNEWFFDGQLYCDECYNDEEDAWWVGIHERK